MRAIMDYAHRTLGHVIDPYVYGQEESVDLVLLEEGAEDGDTVNDDDYGGTIFLEEPLQKSLDIIITGDGAPVEMAARIKDAAFSNNDSKYEKVQFLLGGFHAKLEQYRKKSQLSQEFWGFFVSKWRKSAQEMKWIMDPADPNDLEEELPQYIAGHYRAASV